jgi:hypothetical protein
MAAVHQADPSKIDRRLMMIGLIARWGHNVLLTSIALLTVAVVFFVK